jgi:hypothetical protein
VGIEKNREVMVAEATILKQGYKAIIWQVHAVIQNAECGT